MYLRYFINTVVIPEMDGYLQQNATSHKGDPVNAGTLLQFHNGRAPAESLSKASSLVDSDLFGVSDSRVACSALDRVRKLVHPLTDASGLWCRILLLLLPLVVDVCGSGDRGRDGTGWVCGLEGVICGTCLGGRVVHVRC